MASKVLVIQNSVYGQNDAEFAVSIDSSLLSDEQVSALARSTPSRRTTILGCHKTDGRFVTPGHEELDDAQDANLGIAWTFVGADSESITAYTTAHHCRVVLAYYDE